MTSLYVLTQTMQTSFWPQGILKPFRALLSIADHGKEIRHQKLVFFMTQSCKKLWRKMFTVTNKDV